LTSAASAQLLLEPNDSAQLRFEFRTEIERTRGDHRQLFGADGGAHGP
jgi:hypothetical protein